MSLRIELSTKNIDYSGYDALPKKIKIRNHSLQASYYRRYHLQMSHNPTLQRIYNTFAKVKMKPYPVGSES